MKRLQNKVAIIAGATSGIGKAMAALFAEEGAQVIFTGRREAAGKAVEEEIRKLGYNAEFVQVDSTNPEQLQALVDHVLAKYGRIDVLCNNAGVSAGGEFTQMDLEKEFDWLMNVNVRTYFALSKLVIPHMQKAGAGSIINTASVGAVMAMPYQVTYAATKAAVVQMTRSLAKRYAAEGIRVNSLLPGLTHSEMVEEGSAFEKAVLPTVPMKRAASAREIAMGALFLASDESSYATGLSLLLDGGVSL